MSKMIPNPEELFRDLVPASRGIPAELEEEAEHEGIPIVGPLVGRLLTILARATGARRVLELGTASGYSAMRLAGGMAPDGRLTSLEHDPDMAGRARRNLRRAGLEGVVEVLVGEAADILSDLEPGFDLAFLDIDKAAYAPSLPHLKRLLRPGGLLVADNTAFTAAAAFNRALAEDSGWLEAPLLCFLPGHSPERDGLSLAVRL